MSNQGHQNRAPVPLSQHDVFTNWLYADPVEGGQKRPNFRLKVIGNVPRFIVKTNVPNDKNNGRIEFHTDIETFTVVTKLLDDVATGKEEGPFVLEYNDFIFTQGQRSDKPVTKATIRIGKEANTGRIYIAVLGYQRPKIQFFFGPSDRHALKAGDGSAGDEAFISRMYARACAAWWQNITFGLLNQHFDENARNVAKPPAGPGGGGNNYGGNQGGGNQGGGGNNYGNNYGNGGGNNAPAASGGSVDSFDDFSDSNSF